VHRLILQRVYAGTLGCALLTILSLPVSLNAENATPADKFVDSVGVNIHLHYQDTAYNDFPQVEKALIDLGVHHVRDGLILSDWQPYYNRLNALGKDGIKALLITSPGESLNALDAFPNRVPSVMEGMEGPNELDISGGRDWLQKLVLALPATEMAAEKWRLPLVGPSMTQAPSFAILAHIPQGGALGNLHNYFGGHHPGTPGWGDNGYGSYPWQLRLAHQAWPGKPIWSTETGYVMDPALAQGIPETVAARYILRLLMEQYLHGIERTYLYELLDTNIPSQNVHDRFGLCRSDFSRKPAYLAVQSLLRLLADPSGSPAASALNLQLTGAPADLHHMLFAKSDGEFYLMLWVEEAGYDVDRKIELPVKTVHVKATWPAEREAKISRFEDDGSLSEIQTLHANSADLTVNDRVTVLRIR